MKRLLLLLLLASPCLAAHHYELYPPHIPDSVLIEADPPGQTHTFPALDTNNAFIGNNTFSNINGCLQVDGVKYAFTDVGVQQAVTAAGTKGCVKLSPTTYTFNGTVQIPFSDFVLDMSGAIINMEAAGDVILVGTTTLQQRVKLIGGYIRKTASGVITPTPQTAGNVAVEFRNFQVGEWQSGDANGFEKAVYLHSTAAIGTYYIHIFPHSFIDVKYGVYMQADNASGGSVNDNFVIGGNIQFATNSVNFSGGYCIFLDTGSGNPAFASEGNYIQTSCQNALTTDANRPEAAIWLNSIQNKIEMYSEGTSSTVFGKAANTWVVDNSGANSQRNQFTRSGGGTPIVGLSNFRINNTTNPGDARNFQTVVSERSGYFAGGNGSDPIVVTQEVNGNSNTAYSHRDTNGVERFGLRSDGFIKTPLSPSSSGQNLGVSGNAWYAGFTAVDLYESAFPTTPVAGKDTCYPDSTLHATACSFNGNGFFDVAYPVVLHTAYTNATTTFSTLGDGTRTASFPVLASRDYLLTCDIVYNPSATTAGPKIQVTGPAAPTAVNINVQGATNATAYADGSAAAFSTPITTFGTSGAAPLNLVLRVTAGISNGANAGTVALQLAANGVGTLTVNAGSACRIQ